MTWRRFEVLVSCLSPSSVWQSLLAQDATKPRIITDPDQADKYIKMYFGE